MSPFGKSGSAKTDTELYPGYALPPGRYSAQDVKPPKLSKVLGLWAIAIAVALVVLGGVTLKMTKPPAHYMCPPDCGRPPTGIPVTALPRFTPPDGSFTVAYPEPSSVYDVKLDNRGVTAKFTGGDTGVLQLFSQPARGRSAEDIAHVLLKGKFPDAKIAYEVPNASVGYQPGYGLVADSWPPGASGSSVRIRTLLMVAVKNDLALVAGAVGPYHAFGPDFGPGLPSAVNLQIAQDMGKYVNSFSWKGDPPR